VFLLSSRPGARSGEAPGVSGPSDRPAVREGDPPPQGPLDPRDYSRRTLLANERTFLAWWRTGLTALTVALATARVVPELSNAGTQWPYSALGIGFGLLGLVCIAYGQQRRLAVDRAVRRGEFADPSAALTTALTVGGVLLGAALMVLILLGA
jgi:putative membrane protein